MDKHIATALAVIVVMGTFFGSFFIPSLAEDTGSSETSSGLSLSPDFGLPEPQFAVPNLTDASVSILAWNTFEQYVEYAEERDLEGLSSLSHQLSPACLNPETIEDCNALMDSVAMVAEDFRQEDFVHVAYDERQVVLYTDYIEESGEPVQRVLIFTRSEDSLKLLGIKLCEGDTFVADLIGASCIETDPEKRDADGNGWWDHVEALFYTQP